MHAAALTGFSGGCGRVNTESVYTKAGHIAEDALPENKKTHDISPLKVCGANAVSEYISCAVKDWLKDNVQ